MIVAEPLLEEGLAVAAPFDGATEFGTPLQEITQIGAADFAKRFSEETPLLVVDPCDLATVEVLPTLAALGVETVVAVTHGEGRAALERGCHPLVILVLDKPAPGTRALVLAAAQQNPSVPLVMVLPPDSRPLPRNLLEAGVTAVVPMGSLSPPQWRAHLHALLPNVTPGTTTDQTSIMDTTLAVHASAIQAATQAGALGGVMDAVNTAQRELAAATARAGAAEREAAQTKAALRAKSDEVREVQAQLAVLKEEHRELRQTLQATATHSDAAERSGELFKAALREKAEELMGMRADLSTVRNENRALETRLEALSSEKARLQEEARELELAAGHAQEQATTMAITIEGLEEAANTAKDKLAAQHKTLTEQKAMLTSIQGELAEHKKTAERRDRELETARGEVVRLQESVLRATAEGTSQQQRASALQARLDAVLVELENATKAQAQHALDAAGEKQRAQQTQTQLDEVTARLHMLEGSADGAQVIRMLSDLEAARAETVRLQQEGQRVAGALQKTQADLAARDEALRSSKELNARLEAQHAETQGSLEELRGQVGNATLEGERVRAESQVLVVDLQARLTASQGEARVLAARVKDLEDKLMRYAKDIFLKEEGKSPEMEALRARLSEMEVKLLQADSHAALSRAEWQQREGVHRAMEERLRAVNESNAWLQGQMQQAVAQLQSLGRQAQAAEGWERQAVEAKEVVARLEAQLWEQRSRTEDALARMAQVQRDVSTRVGVPQEAMPIILELATANGVQIQAVDAALHSLAVMTAQLPELGPHVNALKQLRVKLHLLQQRFT